MAGSQRKPQNRAPANSGCARGLPGYARKDSPRVLLSQADVKSNPGSDSPISGLLLPHRCAIDRKVENVAPNDYAEP
jgi:hypothetical protein